jgi:hypothetical protein
MKSITLLVYKAAEGALEVRAWVLNVCVLNHLKLHPAMSIQRGSSRMQCEMYFDAGSYVPFV